MTTHLALTDRLHQLQLTAMAEAWAQQQRDPDTLILDFDDRFAVLADEAGTLVAAGFPRVPHKHRHSGPGCLTPTPIHRGRGRRRSSNAPPPMPGTRNGMRPARLSWRPCAIAWRSIPRRIPRKRDCDFLC